MYISCLMHKRAAGTEHGPLSSLRIDSANTVSFNIIKTCVSVCLCVCVCVCVIQYNQSMRCTVSERNK